MAKTTAALVRTSRKSPGPAPKPTARKPVKTSKTSRSSKARRAPHTFRNTPRSAGAYVPDPCTTLADVVHSRTLFWQDCVRQMLTGLSMIQADHPELFDGRTAVLTYAGERIPIAEVFPLFACGLPTTEQAKAASITVECTVFRVRTPSGEVFTLPVQEIRGLHSLTPELIKELEQSAMARGASDPSNTPSPFGFAAYTPRPSAPAGPVD